MKMNSHFLENIRWSFARFSYTEKKNNNMQLDMAYIKVMITDSLQKTYIKIMITDSLKLDIYQNNDHWFFEVRHISKQWSLILWS